MKNTYAQLMRLFYNSPEAQEADNKPETLALAYANFFRREGPTPNTHPEEVKLFLPLATNNNNVSILSRDTKLSDLTKRVSLIADSTLITHYKETQHKFWNYTSLPKTGHDGDIVDCYLRCPNLSELGKWLRDCKPLLLSGDMFYFPDILVEHTREYWHDNDEITSTEDSIGPLCEFVIDNRKLIEVQPDTDRVIKSKYIHSILQVDLPFIDNVGLANFCKISSDNREAFEQFRDYLRSKFLDLKQNESSETFNSGLAKIGIEMRDGIRKLKSQLSEISGQRAVQVTGAAIGIISAVLVAVDSNVFSNLSSIFGTSGGILAISPVIQEYISKRQQPKDSPYYYLWLIQKCSPKDSQR